MYFFISLGTVLNIILSVLACKLHVYLHIMVDRPTGETRHVKHRVNASYLVPPRQGFPNYVPWNTDFGCYKLWFKIENH